jgi:hypothetical protein
VSLNKKYGPMEASKEVISESEVESEAESTEGDEAKLQEGHNQEAKEVIESKAQSVSYLKKKEHIPIVFVYLHSHHIETQHSSKKGCVHQHIMHQQGTRHETDQVVHGGLPTLWEELRLHKQSHGNPDMMKTKIRVARQQMDIMFDFYWDGWMVVLGTIWLH